VTYAEGIKRMRPSMLVIVLIGDGGCGIGTAHLVHAARRGASIKVVVCNNFNFGMTGGQHSPTTPACACTATTPGGATEHPFDICQTVAANGAAYVARHSALDAACVDSLEAALRTPGFSLVDLWELCTAYFMPANNLRPRDLEEMSTRIGLPFGVQARRERTPARAADAAWPPATAGAGHEHASPVRRTDVRKAPHAAAPHLDWRGRCDVVVAGSAGQRIRSAAGTIGELAVRCGLFAAKLDDFPITVRRGHSISNLIVAPVPILFSSVEQPDLVVVLSNDGLDRVRDTLAALPPGAQLIAASDLDLPASADGAVWIDPRRVEKDAGKTSVSLAVLTAGLVSGGWVSAGVLRQAAQAVLSGPYRDENLSAIEAGVRLASTMCAGPARPAGTGPEEDP
jgi:Pyruvate/2-oxoacid:ferredoxin oxidoreductase gamma subunit